MITNMQQGGIAALQPTPQQQLGSMVGAPSARLGAPKSPQQVAAEQLVESEVPRELEALLKERKALELLASAQRDKQAQQPVQPQTVKSQVEGGLASMMDRLRPGMAQRGRQVQVARNRQMMGLPSAGMPRMADGGPVQEKAGMLDKIKAGLGGLFGGGEEQPAPFDVEGRVIELIKLRENADAEAKARIDQELSSFDPKDVINARMRMSKGMQAGGVVGYAKGDLVRASDIDMDNLLDALMIAESGGNPRAVSAAGAEGAYQIMPSTAAQPGFGVQPMEGSRFDPEASRKFARQYLQAMIDRYGGDVEAALIAYNAGAGNADKFVAAGRDYGVLPLAMQTQPYVDKIMGQLEREGRRRDVQLGGGRTLSTTAPESYTERMRRERADRLRGIETARMPPRPPVETEAETAGIPEALTIAKAQQELRDRGSTSDKYTPEERAAGGIGYLQYLARKQQEKKDEAGRAARYLGMMQNQEDIISRVNPATGLAGIDTRQELTSERSMKSPAQRLEEAVPGIGQAAARYAMSKNMPEAAAARIDERPESTRSRNPLVNLRSDLGEIGSYLRDILGFQEGGEIKKYAGEDGSLVEGDSDLGDALLAALQGRGEPPEGFTGPPTPSPGLLASRRTAANLPSFTGLTRGQLAAQERREDFNRIVQAGNEAIARGEDPDAARAAVRSEIEAERAREEKELEPAGPQGTLQQLAATGETGAALAGLFGEGLERRGDDDPVRFRNVEKAREQAKDREGLMNRIGSALTSDRAKAFANALSKLSYAGGATEGNIGKSLVTGLEAEKQAREKLRLQEAAIEADKLRSEATLEAARQTQLAKQRADLVDALGKYEGTTAYIQALNARVEAGEDPAAARTAIMQEKIAEIMPLLTGQGGLTQMTGLTELPEGVTVTRKG